MPQSKLHIAASGQNAGKWVTCPAHLACRNQTTHISRDGMKDLKAQLREQTGRKINIDDVTEQAALTYLAREEQQVDFEDKIAATQNVDTAAGRMQAEEVRLKLTHLNSLAKKRSRDLKKAREEIVAQYLAVEDSEPVKQIEKKFNEELTGCVPSDFNNFDVHYQATVNSGLRLGNFLTVRISYDTVYDEDRYDERIAKENERLNPAMYTKQPTWDEVQDDNRGMWDVSYDFTTQHDYPLTEDQMEVYKKAVTKERLETAYMMASSRNFPDWAVTGDSNELNRYFNQPARMQYSADRKAQSQINVVMRRIKTIEGAGRTTARLVEKRNSLENELKEAEKMSQTVTDPLTKRAFQSYVSTKRKEFEELDGKFQRAQKTGDHAKYLKAQQELADLRAGLDSREGDKIEEAWKEGATKWLQSQFPSTNLKHARAEADKWLRRNPNMIKDLKKYYASKQTY